MKLSRNVIAGLERFEVDAATEYVPDKVIDPWTEFAHLIEVDRDSPPEAIAAAAQVPS